MTYKELMLKSLSEMLYEGETLMHPIVATAEKSVGLQRVFLGFTEKFLLVVGVLGKEVIDTKRIPLSIKLVKIKKTAIFKEHTINICFNTGEPLIITVSPKVFGIDSQKENFEGFLEYLAQKTPKRENVKLKDIDGTKIRRQYFNGIIYIILATTPTVIIAIAGLQIINNGSLPLNFFSEISVLFFVIACMVFPFVILSLLNRSLFGKTLAVIGEDGIYLENYFIPWENIQQLTYIPDFRSSRSIYRNNFSRAVFAVKDSSGEEFDIKVNQFPLYGFLKIKRLHPELKFKFNKTAVVLMGLAIFSVISIVTLVALYEKIFLNKIC